MDRIHYFFERFSGQLSRGGPNLANLAMDTATGLSLIIQYAIKISNTLIRVALCHRDRILLIDPLLSVENLQQLIIHQGRESVT